jgi:hypothetical protein
MNLLAQFQPLPTVDKNTVTNGGIPDGVVDLNAIPQLFANILAVAISLIGILSFVMFLSGGLKMMTSGGDPKQLEAAKGTITYSILGLVLAIGAFLILTYVGKFLGIDNILIFQLSGK